MALLLGVPPLMTAAAEGASDEIDVCFVVRNAAGWPLAKINATAVRTDVSGPGATVHMTTGADGLVRLTLVRSAWRFALLDELAPTSPARNGLVYLPTFPGQAGAIVPAGATLLPGSGGTVADACGPGRAGFPLMGGAVVMNAPATQGYLEATVVDAAVGSIPLAGARVAALALQADNSAGALTGADGKVRLACIAGASNQVAFTKATYIANATTSPCSATAQTDLLVRLWRTPLSLEYTITNETSLVTTMTGVHEATAAPPKSPVTTARATATTLPATINASACVSFATGGTLDVRPPPLTSPTSAPPYVCSTAPDSQGRATLLLPWTEGGVGDYSITIGAAGYAPQTRAERILAADVLQPGAGTATGIRQVPITLTRASVDLQTIVRDVHNDTLAGASVHLNSTSPAGPRVVVVSGADGTANFTLPTGPYAIAITHDAKERRTCTATLVIGAGGAGALEAVTPRWCFQMVTTGKSAVNAIAIDDQTLHPIPGLRVCEGSVCDVTSADGSFELELTPGTSGAGIQPSRTPKQAWWEFATSLSNAPALGLITEDGAKNLNRTRVETTIFVQNATGAGLAFTDINVYRDSVQIHHANVSAPTEWNNKTGPDGKYHIPINRQVIWSKHVSDPRFDIRHYEVKAWKHRDQGTNATLYDAATGAFHLRSDLTPHTETLTLDPKTGTFSAEVVAWDPHTQTHINGLLVRAVTAGPVPRDRPAGGPVSLVETPGTFTLYNEFGAPAYKACSNGNAKYETHADDNSRCASLVNGRYSLQVLRTTVTVRTRGVDAHTGLLIASYNVTFTGQNGFLCEPMSSPDIVCGPKATTGSGGVVEMKVPWTDADGQLCVDAPSRTFGVLTPVSGTNVPDNVVMQAARDCRAYAPGSGPVALDLRPLRSPAVNRLEGTVKLHTGAVATGAVVNVTNDRPGFLCDPKVHHTPGGGYPLCDAAPVNSTGGFSVVVPAVGPFALTVDDKRATWNVTARLAGHYNESFNNWPANGTAVTATFTLYPREFDALITVLEQAPISADPLTQHTCDSIPTYDVRVRLHDLEAPGGNPMNVPAHYRVVAPAQPDGSCLGIIRVKDWHRDPPTLPVQLQTSWPKTTFSVLLSTDHIQHVGWAAANLGPAETDRRATILMVHADGNSGGGSHTVVGRVTDNDLRTEIRALAGVPARVSATPLDPECASGGVTTYADPDGNYTLPLGCAGNYTLVFTPLVASHWESATLSMLVDETTEVRHVGLDRRSSVLTVTVMRMTSPTTPFPSTYVDPTPFDAATDPAPKLTNGAGQAVFGLAERLVWGSYSLPTAGRAAGVIVYVAPGASTATAYA